MARDPLLSGRPGVPMAIDVPPAAYLAVEGRGAPEGAAFAAAIEALYTLAYAARFRGKALGHDGKVGPLEALWWAEDWAVFTEGARAEWRWQALIRAPWWLDAAGFEGLRVEAARKRAGRPETLAALGRAELLRLEEGACVQALHIGPYSAEGPLIARIHEEIAARGMKPVGRHHEIYLSDARRTAPEKLRTILRQPMGER